MSARITTVLHLAGWILAAFLSHATLSELDRLSPLSVHDTVVALSWDAGQSRDALTAELDGFARETGIVFGKAVPGQELDASTITVFLFGGAETVTPGLPGASADGYSTDERISYRPAGELGARAPIGSYFVYGEDADALRVAEFLRGHGFTVNDVIDSDDPLTRLRKVDPGVETVARLAGLVVIVTAGGAALLRRREHGVAFLQGLSWRDRWGAHVRSTATRWGLVGLAVLPAAAIWLWTYNQGRGWGLLLGVTAVVSGALLLLDLAVTAVTLALLSRMSIPRALSGALPVRAVTAVSGLAVVLSGLALVSSVAETAAYGTDLRERTANLAPYVDAEGAVTIALTALNREDDERATEVLERWLMDLDRSGEVILAAKGDLPAPEPLPMLTVNDAYLAAQPVLRADGTSFAAPPGTATVLIPSTLWDRRERIMAGTEWAALIRDGSGVAPEPVEIRPGAHFTYSTGEGGIAGADAMNLDGSSSTDPVILAVSSVDGPLRPYLWGNAASGEVIFPGPEVVERALAADPRLNDVVLYTSPVGGEARSECLQTLHHFQAALMAALLSAAVLLVAGLLVTYMYSRVAAQWTFAHHLHGRRFVLTHRWFLLAATAVLATIVAWLPWRVWLANREYHEAVDAGFPAPVPLAVLGPEQMSAMAAVALLVAATVLAALAHNHRRVVRRGASEA